uniref:Arachidonate 15-lipoxygenase B-like n=1 Tax=Neolamprologus brichardi TaxID=32507 RepID=A0A3Q4H8Y3_NEOBR
MVQYIVTVFTGDRLNSTTLNNVYIKLVGTDGESDRTWLMGLKGASSFVIGAVSKFKVSCPTSLGNLVLIEIDKQSLPLFPEDAWFCAKVEVKSPEGDIYIFPIYRWIADSKVHRFRDGKVFEDNHHLGRYSRQQEIHQREEDYRWDAYAEKIPHSMKAESPFSLPYEVQFSFTKTKEFLYTASTGLTELKLKGLDNRKEKWDNIDSINRVFCCKKTEISEYVQEHWKEDAFFGYQFLNGVNPMLIQLCTALPSNFPVTDDMVFPHGRCSLADEMKKGNIFLCDYKRLDGVKANTINGKKQYLMAPLVLLHKDPHDKLMPIAIQVIQTLRFKFVYLSDILFATICCPNHVTNTVPSFPQLLNPHTRYTLQINFLARRLLISDTGNFTQFASSGGEGMFTILQRSVSSLTYSSLCIPDDIAERGVEAVPNFYYRDDGLKVWDIIHRFVQAMLGYYYKSDREVQEDSELQKWILDIFEHGFLSQAETGIPQKFTSVTELIKFVTMVIYTCSAQHAAVNCGQFDYAGWMPNTPISLQLPPPTTKGTTSEATMLATFPDVNVTVQGMATVWLLSKQSSDFVPLGQYPEDHFTEEIPHKIIKDFQTELEILSGVIKARNKNLNVPYTYMDPAVVENSVAI